MAAGRLFSAGAKARLCIAKQNSRPSAILLFVPAAVAARRGAGPVPSPLFVAMKAAAGAVVSKEGKHPMTKDHDDTAHEPPHPITHSNRSGSALGDGDAGI